MRNDIIKNSKIFIDTCSLMHASCLPFFKSISKTLKESGNGVIIAKGVYDELKKHSCSDDKNLREKSYQGITTIKYLTSNKVGAIYGDKNDGFVDNLFQSLFLRFRQKYNLCLITQDVNLMKDIYELTKSRSVYLNKELIVYKFINSSSSGKTIKIYDVYVDMYKHPRVKFGGKLADVWVANVLSDVDKQYKSMKSFAKERGENFNFRLIEEEPNKWILKDIKLGRNKIIYLKGQEPEDLLPDPKGRNKKSGEYYKYINDKRLVIPFKPIEKDHQLVKNTILNDKINPFKASRKVVDKEKFKTIILSSIPKTGDSIVSHKGISITLKEKIASGAEGDIYTFELTDQRASSDQYLCKVYKKDKISFATIEKLQLMISKKIDIEGVSWPISLLYNSEKEIVGYVMKKAFGYELQRSLFIEPLRIKKLGSDWTRKDLIRLSINILTTIDSLHKHNIIIGDINPGNIMVDKNSNAYFIDTDSYQIEGYPCPVGSPTFTHPDILRKKFISFLRKREHEYFAISTLLFMILVPGKSPFACQGGTSPAANVKKRNFVYPFSSNEVFHKSKEISKNRWWYVWNNFPHKLKEAFYKSFVNGNVIAIQGKDGWLDILDAYLHNIKKGWVSDEIFPTTEKEVPEEQKQKFMNRS